MPSYKRKTRNNNPVKLKNIPKPIVIKRDWADAVIEKKSDESSEVLEVFEEIHQTDLIKPIGITKDKRVSVMNRIPKNKKNVDHDYWSYKYDKYILGLYNIFCDGIDKLEYEPKISLKSPEFLHMFSKFILSSSSGEINKFI